MFCRNKNYAYLCRGFEKDNFFSSRDNQLNTNNNHDFKGIMKKFAMAILAAIMLVSCGGDFVGELVGAYEAGAEKVKAAKNIEELNAAKAETNKQTATIKNSNLEKLNDMFDENKKDSTEYAEEIIAISKAEAAFVGAVKAKETELAKNQE